MLRSKLDGAMAAACGAWCPAPGARRPTYTHTVLEIIVVADHRQAARKIVRAKAMLVMDGAPPVAARTHDIGTGGVSVTVDEGLSLGARGRIMFEIFIDGKGNMIEGQVGVTYSILSHDGYSVGLQFFNLELGVANAIAKYMR